MQAGNQYIKYDPVSCAPHSQAIILPAIQNYAGDDDDDDEEMADDDELEDDAEIDE